MPAAGPSSAKTSQRNYRSDEVIPSDSSAASSERASSVDSNDIDTASTPKRTTGKTTAKGSERRPTAFAKYQPPSGMNTADVSSAFKASPFEYDALSRPGVELWAIRLPADFKPSRLSQMSLKKPKSGEVKGTLKHKGSTYAFTEAASTKDTDSGIGAEMTGMSLVVPRMASSGKLFRAPVEISRRLVLSPSHDLDSSSAFQAPTKTKREQPEHLLKFRNRAYGFDTPGPSANVLSMLDDDEDDDVEGAAESSPQAAESSPKKRKSKEKRSGDEEGKKRKKVKGETEQSPSRKKTKSSH